MKNNKPTNQSTKETQPNPKPSISLKQTIWNCCIYLSIYLHGVGDISFMKDLREGWVSYPCEMKPVHEILNLSVKQHLWPWGPQNSIQRPQPGETFSVNTMQRERVGRKGMKKWFCITLSLFCLDWKPLSPCPSRQCLDHLEIVPSSFLYRAEAGTVCYGQCQGTRQPTGRKVLFLKKKKKKKATLEPWAWDWGDMEPIPSPLLILGGLGQATLLTLFSSAWKSRMEHGRGVSLPAPPGAAGKTWWIKWALYLCFSCLPLHWYQCLQVYLCNAWKDVPRGWYNLPPFTHCHPSPATWVIPGPPFLWELAEFWGLLERC